MSFVIEGLGLAHPPHPIAQEALAQAAVPCSCEKPQQQRLLPTLYRRSTVQQRHSVVVSRTTADGFDGSGGAGGSGGADGLQEQMLAFYPPAANAAARGPSTAIRMERYAAEALPLAEAACRRALDAASLNTHAVSQLVVVTCTGFAAPGVDIGLIDRLGLPADVGRTMIGFMGCHGAMNGLRVAGALADSAEHDIQRGSGAVLLCCVELCTLHFQYGWDPQKIVANALFADGAAAVVGRFGSAEHDAEKTLPCVTAHGSLLLPGSRDAMSWNIGDHGFEMTLSPRVPDLILTHLRAWLDPWLARQGLTTRDIQGWAIHPGGPRVIRAVEEALDLPAGAGDCSRHVLANYGNMSSPTVLFILDRLRKTGVERPWVTLAFGPGLTIEAAVIR